MLKILGSLKEVFQKKTSSYAGKDFFDLSDEEQKELLEDVASEANEDQRNQMIRFGENVHT